MTQSKPVNLLSRVVADRRKVDQAIESSGVSLKQLLDRLGCDYPANLRVIFGSPGFGSKRNEQHHVVKSNDMFEDGSRVPARAG